MEKKLESDVINVNSKFAQIEKCGVFCAKLAKFVGRLMRML